MYHKYVACVRHELHETANCRPLYCSLEAVVQSLHGKMDAKNDDETCAFV